MNRANDNPTRSIRLIATAVSTAAVLGAVAYGFGSADHPRPPAAKIHPTAVYPTAIQPTAVQPVVAGPFAGTWHVHNYEVNINADGAGSAHWRTYVWCDQPNLPQAPCDAMVPTTITLPDGRSDSVQEIIDGGRATLRLVSTTGSIAHAVVEGSTEQSVLPDGPATIMVMTNDLLDISTAAPSFFGHTSLCGPQASALSISEQNAKGINCGA